MLVRAAFRDGAKDTYVEVDRGAYIATLKNECWRYAHGCTEQGIRARGEP